MSGDALSFVLLINSFGLVSIVWSFSCLWAFDDQRFSLSLSLSFTQLFVRTRFKQRTNERKRKNNNHPSDARSIDPSRSFLFSLSGYSQRLGIDDDDMQENGGEEKKKKTARSITMSFFFTVLLADWKKTDRNFLSWQSRWEKKETTTRTRKKSSETNDGFSTFNLNESNGFQGRRRDSNLKRFDFSFSFVRRWTSKIGLWNKNIFSFAADCYRSGSTNVGDDDIYRCFSNRSICSSSERKKRFFNETISSVIICRNDWPREMLQIDIVFNRSVRRNVEKLFFHVSSICSRSKQNLIKRQSIDLIFHLGQIDYRFRHVFSRNFSCVKRVSTKLDELRKKNVFSRLFAGEKILRSTLRKRKSN